MKRVQNESIREGMKKGLSAKSDRKKNNRAVRTEKESGIIRNNS